jgi:valyl-tRNA synthetase
VHRAPWPGRHELTRAAEGGDARVVDVVSRALSQVRRAKSERRLSMRTEVPLAEARGPAAELELLSRAADDLRAAGHIGRLELLPDRTDKLLVACAF